MAELERSASKLAWLWVIEYVSSLQQLDPSFSHALIDEASELIGDLGDDVRERVALRCLEHMFDSRNEKSESVPSLSMPKFKIDFSRSCADVLRSMRTSMSDLRTGNDLLKWDMQSFIEHKRTTLPKCSLERMKEELLEGVHPAFLIEHSGLMHKDDVGDGDLHLNAKMRKCNSVDDQQNSPLDVSSSGFPTEFVVVNCEDSVEHLFDGDEFDHDKFDVAMERSLFPSSQCTQRDDGENSKDGQFFVCSALCCRTVVPKDRLGCSPKFDDDGDFYCPSCAYSYASSKLMEAEAKAASVKKELAPFFVNIKGKSLEKPSIRKLRKIQNNKVLNRSSQIEFHGQLRRKNARGGRKNSQIQITECHG